MNETQLRSCTHRELLTLAGKSSVRGRHRMSKDQLIAAIRSHNAARRPGRPRQRSVRAETATSTPANVSSPNSVDALAAGQQQEAEPQELTELPSSYGQTRLTLMGVDPFWIHVYWEVTPHDREAAMARLGPERASAHWVLRFYDVTYIDFDGTNAHGYFDQPVDLAANSWYVNLWSSEKTYCADIGALAPTGRFEPACRSNFVYTPRADESPHYRPKWLHVEGVSEKVERLALPPLGEVPATAADPAALAATAPLTVTPAIARAEQELARRDLPPRGPAPLVGAAAIRKYYDGLLPLARAAGASEPATTGNRTNPARAVPQDASGEPRPGSAWHEVRGGSSPTLSSFDRGSWAPTGRAAPDLKSNAEVDPSGRIPPSQAVQVDRQRLEENSKGTFSVRPVMPVRK
jgi:hypothetical protein